MTILENAFDAINCGIEDFGIGTPRRLKSAIRNIHAGILLLFKEKLRQLSPPNTDEALIKERVLPTIVDSGVVYVGKGKKTVDVQSIQDRFESLGIKFCLKEFRKFSEIRNEIEHYDTTLNQSAIAAAIANTFLLVRSFCVDHLAIDPAEKMDDAVWQSYINIKNVHQKELEDCVRSHAKVDLLAPSLNTALSDVVCSECGSDLLLYTDDRSCTCRSCASYFAESEIIKMAVDALSSHDYVNIKDGGDPAVISCPECNEKGYVVSDGLCALCGQDQLTDCQQCGIAIPASEIDGSGYCGYCSHKMNKDLVDD